MYEFVSGYTLPLALFVSIFFAVLVYAYYTYEQSEVLNDSDYTIRNFVDDITEAPEQKKVSKEDIETLEKEMSRLEHKIAAMETITSRTEADALQSEIKVIHQKIAEVYNNPAL